MTVLSVVLSSVLTVALLVGPTVDLVTRDLEAPLSTVAFRGQLLDRILEAGHPIRREADAKVVLASGDAGVSITLEREGERWQETVPVAGRPSEVVGLEVAQRVVAMLARHGGDSASAPQNAVKLDPQISDAETRNAFLTALVDANFALVPGGEAADWIACAMGHDAMPKVAFAGSAEECAAALTDAEPTDDLLVGVQSAAVRAGLKGSPEPEPEPEPPSEEPLPDADFRPSEARPPQPEEERPREPPVVTREPLEFAVFAGAGVGVRPQVSGRYAASLLLGRERGPTGLFEVSFLPSRGESDLRVLDVPLALGFAWRLSLSAKWRLVPAAALGVRLHNPRFGSDRVGTAVDPHVTVPVRLHWLATKRLRVGLRVAGAFDGRRREHRVNGASAWTRSAWRFDAGLVLGVSLGRG